jgi:hypothetical protein
MDITPLDDVIVLIRDRFTKQLSYLGDSSKIGTRVTEGRFKSKKHVWKRRICVTRENSNKRQVQWPA